MGDSITTKIPVHGKNKNKKIQKNTVLPGFVSTLLKLHKELKKLNHQLFLLKKNRIL